MLSNKELRYKAYTLGDIGVIELLIVLRYKYDENMYIDDSIPSMAVGIGLLNEEMIVTYADLDRYIDECNFNKEQLKILKMVSEGYSLEEIARELNLFRSTMEGRLSTIYNAIAKQNEWYWRKSVYKHKLGLKDKTCSRCGHEMPATLEFYNENNYSRDGFLSICKRCRI